MDFSVLKKLLPLADEEGTVYNQKALNTLKSGRDAELANALQGQEANASQPLTQKLDLSGIDASKLPANGDKGFQLVGGPQDKGFTLQDSSAQLPAISSGGLPATTANGGLPASLTGARPDLASGSTIDISPMASKWQSLKDAAPYAGAAAAGTAAGLMSGGDTPSAQAAKPAAPMPAKVAPAADDSDDDEEDDAPAAKSSKAAALTPSTAVEDNSEPAKSAATSANPNIASLDKLQELHRQMQQQLALNNAGRNMSDTVYAMSGKANPFDKGMEDQAKQAGLPTEQYLQQTEFQKQDPNSPISQAYRKLASELDPKMEIPANMSAADLEKMNPQLANIRTREDMIEARKEMAKDRNAEMHFRNEQMALAREGQSIDRQNKRDTQEQNILDKRLDNWGKALGTPSNRTPLGQSITQMQAIDRVQALLTGHGDPNNLTDSEVAEVAKGLDRVISGGASTLEGSKTLNPSTARQEISKMLGRVVNAPQAAGGGAFLQRINHNLENERNVSRKNALTAVRKVLGAGASLAHSDNPLTKEKFNSFMLNQGLPQDLLEQANDQGKATYYDPNEGKTAAKAPQAATAPAQSGSAQIVPGISHDDLDAELAKRAAAKAAATQGQ